MTMAMTMTTTMTMIMTMTMTYDNDNDNSGGSSPTECKSISNGKTTYFGTVSDGFTASEVHKGAAKLVSLLGMAGSFVGPSIGKLVAECKADYTADLVEQLYQDVTISVNR